MMEGLNADTIAAMSIWSLWVAVGLALVGRPVGTSLSVTYLGLAVLLWARSDMPWRAYLAGSLALHVFMAARAAFTARSEFSQSRGGQSLASAVSLAGLIWLSVGGGVRYWLPLVVAAAVALVVVVFIVVVEAHSRAKARAPVRAQPTSARRPRPQSATSAMQDPRAATSANLPPSAGPALRGGPSGDVDLDRGFASSGVDHIGLAAALNPASVHGAPRFRPDPAQLADQDLEATSVARIPPRPARPRAPLLHVGQLEKIRPASLDIDVTAHPGNTVRAVGLSWLSGPTELTVSDSMAVVRGDHNRVSLKTHYRIRRFDISLRDLRSGSLPDAVRALAAGGSVSLFQHQVRRHLSMPAGEPDSFRDTIAALRTVTIESCNHVQVGHHSRMDIDNRFVIDTTTVPILLLLATDAHLVQAFAQALSETQPGPATAGFLRLVVQRTGDLADRDLLDSIAELATPDTWISALFGAADVTGAAVVMLGADNKLTTRLTADRPGLEVAGLRRSLIAMRPVPPAPEAPDAASQVVSMDTVPDITRLPEIEISPPHPGQAAGRVSTPGIIR